MWHRRRRVDMRAMTFIGVLGMVFSLYADEQVYQAPHPEPTAEEVLIVELMNRYRANPVREGTIILNRADGLPGFFWSQRNFTVDREMFREEMDELTPAPPLVIDLVALKAARQHSHYMIVNNMVGHNQKEGNPGFTGRSFSDRLRHVGFSGNPGAENAFREAGNAWESHAGFIIDFGPGGPGGMQNGRGHRMNMVNSRFNVVGASAVPHGNRFSVTHKLGTMDGRFVGGVVYHDRNRNGFFDVGEEIAEAVVATDDGAVSVTTWRSGGYTLKLPHTNAATVTITVGDLTAAKEIPAGSENVHFSWAVPPAEDLAAADRLLAQVDAIPDDERSAQRRRRPLLALWAASQQLTLDRPRQERIEALTADIANEVAASKAEVLAAIDDGDRRTIASVMREAQREWRGTVVGEWLEQANALAQASDGVRSLEAAREAGRTIDSSAVKQLRDNLQAARREMQDPELRQRFQALIDQVGK
ncbi:MAG: hypothetical protein EA401_10470 [Planctomycetota bacterium]|nr:MAG: hypothetical protein EA401_10470 [Planctomycetota bacterium]